jgi:hypothetical protein
MDCGGGETVRKKSLGGLDLSTNDVPMNNHTSVLTVLNPTLLTSPPFPNAAATFKGDAMESINPPSPPTAQNSRQWTPELIVQAFKEGVTALLGLILVVAMVILAWRTYTLMDTPVDDKSAQLIAQKVTWAKDILVLIIGPAGVVLGYYFGRVPAQ